MSARRPVAWGLRLVVGLAVVVSGAVHVWLVAVRGYGGGTGNWLATAFWLQGVGGIVLGLLVLAWRSVLPLLGAVAFGAATLGGFLLAVYLPDGLGGVRSAWGDWPELVSAVTEVLAIVLGLAAIAVERGRRTTR